MSAALRKKRQQGCWRYAEPQSRQAQGTIYRAPTAKFVHRKI
jgi:hypothetical protein